MKEQLNKELKKLGQTYPHTAAAEAIREAEPDFNAAYDEWIRQGKTELEAYRKVLEDIEKMEAILAHMPLTEEEQKAKEEEESKRKKAKKINGVFGSLQGLMWISTVILYFLISFLFGHWHLTWLLFLGGSMGSIVLEIAAACLKGVPFSAQTGKLHGLMWLAITEAYFLISLLFGGWHLTWLMFPLGAAVELLLRTISKWRK